MDELTQKDLVLRALRLVGPAGLTQKEAYGLCDTTRLAARIGELRGEGHPIETRWERKGRRKWARYVLVEQQPRVRVLEEPVIWKELEA